MELQQVKNLKLNATRIKSTLIKSNKQIRKLKVQERNFLATQQNETRKQQKEAVIEASSALKGPQTLATRILAGPLSLFEKIKQFFGTVLLGILVNNLPLIVQKIQKFLDDNKVIIDTIKTVIKFTGNALMGLIDAYNSISVNISKINQERKKITKEIDEILREAMLLVSDTQNLDKEFAKEFKDEYVSRTPDQVVNDVKQSIVQSNIPKSQVISQVNQYSIVQAKNEPSKPVVIPGIGSYAKTKGFLGLGTKERATDNYGTEISVDEFKNRYQVLLSRQDEIFNDLKAQGIQGYSEGGTVKPSRMNAGFSGMKESFSGESASARKARESTSSFSDFENTTIATGGIIEIQKENNDLFEKMLDGIKSVFKVDGEDDDDSPEPPPSPDQPPPSPGNTLPDGTVVPGNGKVSGGAIVTQRNDPDGNQTGIDISIAPHKIGALIQNPFESLEITGKGFQGSGSGERGSGFGNWISGKTVINGKTYELLLGHLDKVHVSKGNVLNAGDSIGTQGITGRAKGPHVSTHINALDGGNAQAVLDAVENSWVNGTVIKTKSMKKDTKIKPGQVIKPPPGTTLEPAQVDPVKEGVEKILDSLERKASNAVEYKFNVAKSTRNDLTQTFDDGGETVMIMSQQPIIIPGQDRYIVRNKTKMMPISVPVAQKPSSLRGFV